MIQKLIVAIAALSFSVSAFAQDDMGGEKKPFSIYGDFATSLQFFDSENASAGAQQNAAGRHDDFNIDLIELNIEKNWSKSKLHLSIGYGSTAHGVNVMNAAFGTVTSVNTVNVMNAYYKMMSDYGLNFWIGKFESPVGHETYNHMDNSQFTRSWGFNLAPFFSTGLGVDYGTDMWRVGLIASNGSGQDTDRKDDNKTLGLIVDIDPMENLHFDLNYVTGREGFGAAGTVPFTTYTVSILDISASYMVNEMFDFAINYLSNTQDAGGATDPTATSIAAYVNANFGMFGLGLRYEMFDYDNGIMLYNGPGAALGAVGADNSLSAITLTAKAEIDQNAAVVLEYRMDSADDNGTFVDADNNATDSFSTITAGLMYRF